jgi:type IV pilus assembly protein PilW
MNGAFVMKAALDHTPKKANAGFTLVELMASLVLGLLLVAAAVQVLYGGVVSSRLQQGAADAQDSGLFGLDYITKDVRMANYGNLQNLILSDTTPAGGIVLTADTATPNATVTNLSGVLSGTAFVANGLLSHGAGDTAGTGNQWTGATKVTVSGTTTPQSDQLTIQFVRVVIYQKISK